MNWSGILIGLACFLAVPAAFLLYLSRYTPAPRCSCRMYLASTQTGGYYHGTHACCPLDEVIF